MICLKNSVHQLAHLGKLAFVALLVAIQLDMQDRYSHLQRIMITPGVNVELDSVIVDCYR